tara:strand:+ start:7495 stop:8685 length:1191 start_codon:yes stop_codon:yes gene_type:complete
MPISRNVTRHFAPSRPSGQFLGLLLALPLSLSSGLTSDLYAQDELDPAPDPTLDPSLDPSMDPILQDGDDPDVYTFEDSGLSMFDRTRRDGEPPIGIAMSEENLPAGTSALRVRLSRTSFDGLGNSRRDVTSAQAFAAGFTVAPTSMTVNRAEFEYVHGFNERWTIWGVLPVVEKELDADINGGGTSTSKTSGLGDVRLGGNYLFHEDESQRVNFSIGVTLPTGEFDGRDTYGAVANALLPYAMQLGGGTFDILPSAGWVRLQDGWSMGARAWGRFPIGKNSDDWAISREFDADFWASRELSQELTGMLRLNAQWWGDIQGNAAGLNLTNSPLEDSGFQGGSRLNLIGGIIWDLDARTAPAANRLELEIGVPIDQRLDGPALQREWSLLLGWKLSL